MAYLEPHRISQLIDRGDSATLRELLTRYDGLIGNPQRKVIVAASGGFLTGNFPPARIFLGDMGSATLGLLAATFSLVGVQRGLFPLWLAWLAFSPFIVDATWTLLRRLSRGDRVWQAHRSHHYQRFVLAGWSLRAVRASREAPDAVHRGEPFNVTLRLENRKTLVPAMSIRV